MEGSTVGICRSIQLEILVWKCNLCGQSRRMCSGVFVRAIRCVSRKHVGLQRLKSFESAWTCWNGEMRRILPARGVSRCGVTLDREVAKVRAEIEQINTNRTNIGINHTHAVSKWEVMLHKRFPKMAILQRTVHTFFGSKWHWNLRTRSIRTYAEMYRSIGTHCWWATRWCEDVLERWMAREEQVWEREAEIFDNKVCTQKNHCWQFVDDILWSVNKLARSITKWTKVCDKRLNRLISYIHHTSEYKQYCHVGNTAKQCRLALFQDSGFAGDLEDSKNLLLEETLCVFESHTFVFKKLDVQETSCCFSQFNRIWNHLFGRWIEIRRDSCSLLLGSGCFCPWKHDSDSWKTVTPVVKVKDQRSQGTTNVWNRVDCVPSNVQFSKQEALLYVFEDNEAVIKMIFKGRSPTMRHVSRTHRVALDWLFDRINLDPKIQINYIDTKNQLADILTKGNFTRDKWNHLLCLFNISHFSSTVCSETMAKRLQQDSGEERVTGKIATNDEPYCKGAVERIILDFSKPVEEKVMEIKIPGVQLLRKRKDRGDPMSAAIERLHLITIIMNNLWEVSPQQVTQSGMMTMHGLLKSGKLILEMCDERPWDPM